MAALCDYGRMANATTIITTITAPNEQGQITAANVTRSKTKSNAEQNEILSELRDLKRGSEHYVSANKCSGDEQKLRESL